MFTYLFADFFFKTINKNCEGNKAAVLGAEMWDKTVPLGPNAPELLCLFVIEM